MNQGISITSPSSDSPAKRRRGRPRKDDTPSQSSEISPPAIQHFLTPAPPSTSSGADVSPDDEDKSDEMVGQVVTGVLESSFDAGYFVRVKVGNGNMCMNGVVFKEGCVVPITPENDVAPNVKMYTRQNFAIPTSLTPKVVSEKEDGQDQKVLEGSGPDLNADQVVLGDIDVSNKPEEKKDEIELSRVVLGDIDVSDKLEEKKDETECSKDANEKENCSTRADLEELSEPPTKMQKIEEALESEVVIQPDSEVDVKETCQDSGLKISMENAEGDEVSVMDTEKVEE